GWGGWAARLNISNNMADREAETGLVMISRLKQQRFQVYGWNTGKLLSVCWLAGTLASLEALNSGKSSRSLVTSPWRAVTKDFPSENLFPCMKDKP
ncbi:MAG TPA: hypothetical protein PKD72_08565, partial [Gemmatales bacterium]|nr:hypothetical protein [Gemmatales bacterium]